jgi:hypothetical protein
MTDPKDWKKVYEAVRAPLEPEKQLQLCLEARRLIQRRLVERVLEPGDDAEREELEEALRDLWVLEQNIRNPKIQ